MANKAISPARQWLSAGFSFVEDAIYVGLGVLLAGVAIALLATEIGFFSHYIVAGQLSENVVMLLDRILLVIIFAEVLYTVQVPFASTSSSPDHFSLSV